MTTQQVETLKKFFAVLTKPPTITLSDELGYDDPAILIDGGAFTIRETEIERKALRGTVKVPGFALDVSTYRPATRWEPEEQDFSEVCANQRYEIVARESVIQWAKVEVDGLLEQIANEEMAKQYEEDWIWL